MTETILYVLVFLGTLGLLVGTYTFFNRRRLSASDAALQRLREVEQAQEAARSILRTDQVSEVPVLDRLLSNREITSALRKRLQAADVAMTPGAFVLVAAISAVAGVLVLRFFTTHWLSPVLGLALGAAIPGVWLSLREKKRLRAFEEQLPDALDMLVSAMKAGYSFQAAMKFIGEEIPEPLGPEFARFYEEQRLGMEVRTALLALQDRIDSLDLRMFVTAVLIQRETGGNLGEVLGKISTLMRDRSALKGEIDAMTAESKLSARILGSLPFVVFGLVNLINPGFMRPMLETSAGIYVFLAAAMSVGIGYWIMMRIADIEV